MEGLTFYNFPWDGPTFAVVEHKGITYEVREGWGCREGWTHDFVATPMSDEDVHQYGSDMTEVEESEVQRSYDEETLEGILVAVGGE